MGNGRKRVPWEKPGPGEWVQPHRRCYYLACCDCGLVHKMQFKLVTYGDGKHKIRFRAWRDGPRTGGMRAHKKRR